MRKKTENRGTVTKTRCGVGKGRRKKTEVKGTVTRMRDGGVCVGGGGGGGAGGDKRKKTDEYPDCSKFPKTCCDTWFTCITRW